MEISSLLLSLEVKISNHLISLRGPFYPQISKDCYYLPSQMPVFGGGTVPGVGLVKGKEKEVKEAVKALKEVIELTPQQVLTPEAVKEKVKI